MKNLKTKFAATLLMLGIIVGLGFTSFVRDATKTVQASYQPFYGTSTQTVEGDGSLITLANVAKTGIYSDLTGKPTIPSAQINSDWNATSGLSQITNKPTLATVATSGAYPDLTGKPSLGVAYEGTTMRTGSFPIFKSTTVTSGNAVFNLTADGTSGGTALCTNGVIQDSVQAAVNDATAIYPMSWTFSNGNKTLSVLTNKASATGVIALLGINLLGAPVTAANGLTVKLTVWCY